MNLDFFAFGPSQMYKKKSEEKWNICDFFTIKKFLPVPFFMRFDCKILLLRIISRKLSFFNLKIWYYTNHFPSTFLTFLKQTQGVLSWIESIDSSSCSWKSHCPIKVDLIFFNLYLINIYSRFLKTFLNIFHFCCFCFV